jgi:hypothetical protein
MPGSIIVLSTRRIRGIIRESIDQYEKAFGAISKEDEEKPQA